MKARLQRRGGGGGGGPGGVVFGFGKKITSHICY